MGNAQLFAAETAVFSTLDLALVGPAETCPLCQKNPPILKYHIGSAAVRQQGCLCLTCACQLLNDIATREIGHWMTRRDRLPGR